MEAENLKDLLFDLEGLFLLLDAAEGWELGVGGGKGHPGKMTNYE